MSATELFKSRLGQQGTNGAYFVRRFIVETANQDTDPLKDGQLPPRYDPYPFNPALLVLEHRVEDRWTNTKSIVEVIYGDPNIVPPIVAGPWSVSVNTGLSSETLYVTPVLTTPTGANSPPSIVIGPHVYVLPAVAPATNPPHAVSGFTSSTATSASVGLLQLPGRKSKPIERRVPVGALVARARFFSVSMASLASAQNYVTYLNDSDWYGYSPLTLMFAGLTIDYVPDPSGITPVGYATDVTLVFECNKNTWDYKITDTYQSGDYEDVVKSNGNVVTSTHRLYEIVNFDTVLALIG